MLPGEASWRIVGGVVWSRASGKRGSCPCSMVSGEGSKKGINGWRQTRKDRDIQTYA